MTYTGSVEQWVDFDSNKVDAEDEVDGTVEAETLLVYLIYSMTLLLEKDLRVIMRFIM